MNLKCYHFLPILLSFIFGMWYVHFRNKNIDVPNLDPIKYEFDWLRLYSLMEEDYFKQNQLKLNFRYFLPRTYFFIPNHMKQFYQEPLYNEDLLDPVYGLNQTLTEKKIQFSQTIGRNVKKNSRFSSFMKKQLDSKGYDILMFQKQVDINKNVLQDNRFFKAMCINNKIYTTIDDKIISQYFLHEESTVLINRILEIQKYLSKFIIMNNRRCNHFNLFEIEVLFTQQEGKYKRPYVENIYNVKKIGVNNIDTSKLVEIKMNKNYIQSDTNYKIFSYDYDFRLKRVIHQCVSNYKYHYQWIKQQPDLLYLEPICDKSNTSLSEANKIYRRSDILLMKKLDRFVLIQNLTIYNFLVNSDIVNNKLHFYQFAHQLDQENRKYDFQLSQLLPKTYAFNLSSNNYTQQEEEFMNLLGSEMWISKPLDQLGGKGINVYQNSSQIKEYIKKIKQESQNQTEEQQQVIVQRYIQNPLLVNKKKFDIRSYVIVVSTDPYIVYFLNGYVRLTINDYNKNDTDLLTHLVNTNIQKKHPQFNFKKDDSHWELNKFESALKEQYNMTDEEIEIKIYSQMKRASAYLFKGLQQYFNAFTANFQIFGLDFMFDEDFNPYFIEVNEIPQLLGQTATHTNVCPEIVNQQLDSCLYANGQILKGEEIDIKVLQNKCKNCNLLINQEKIFYVNEINAQKQG
ncbi:hypothetical protein ABPG72_003947 [Tetrahymena utriculariae]